MMPTRYKTWSLDIVTRYNICTLWLVTFWQLERSGKFSEFLIFLLLLGWSYLVTLIQPGNILALNRRSTNWARDCELVLTCASIKYLSWKYLLKWGVAAAKNYRFSTTPCLKLLQIFGNKMRATHGLCYDSVKSIKRAVLYVMNICTLCLSQSSISARSRNTEMSSVQAHTALLAWRVPNRSDGLYSIIMCHPKIGALQASCDPDQDSVVVFTRLQRYHPDSSQALPPAAPTSSSPSWSWAPWCTGFCPADPAHWSSHLASWTRPCICSAQTWGQQWSELGDFYSVWINRYNIYVAKL